MKYNPITRRYFLQGMGGALMTLPVLPSLLPKAHGQSLPISKFLVMIGSGHGGTGYTSDWYPAPVVNADNSGLLTVRNLFNSQAANEIPHQYRFGLLQQMLSQTPAGHLGGSIDGSTPRTSFVLGRFLNPHISKMNLYRGIDLGTFYSGHHRGVFGGNLKEAVNNTTARDLMEAWPTLDQFLANSPKFYRTEEDISTRIMQITGGISYQLDGTVAPPLGFRVHEFYNSIFSKYENNQSPAVVAERARKQFLIDKVIEDYQSLSKGAFGPARQISSEDKNRLEQHADFLLDLQKKFQNTINNCSDVARPIQNLSLFTNQLPNGFNDLPKVYDLITDLMVAAFHCGASRLGMINSGVQSTAPDYHQSVAHAATTDPQAQVTHNLNFRWTAEHIITPLITKMDAFKFGDGTSILDKGLVLWTHECGPITHQHDSLGLVSFGSLGGSFQTGRYLDYRNINNFGLKNRSDDIRRPGIPIQRLWANIIRAMGHTTQDFERNGRPGYGDSSVMDYPKGTNSSNQGHHPYPTTVMNSLSELLPGLSS